MTVALLCVFAVGLIIGMPLVAVLIWASLTPGLINPDFTANIQFVMRGIVGGGDNTGILAAPLFILSGIIMAKGGISAKIFNVFAYFLGRVPGGMPCAVVVTCLFYGAISGSGTATCAAVGAMTIPILLELGYEENSPAHWLLPLQALALSFLPAFLSSCMVWLPAFPSEVCLSQVSFPVL